MKFISFLHAVLYTIGFITSSVAQRSAQSASSLSVCNSVKTAPEGGVLNVQGCNTTIPVMSLAASAYCSVSELEQWNCKTCSQNVSDITVIDDDTHIIMAYDASLKSHFISIRGSSDINNWISNIQTRIIYPYFDKNIGVHNGLYHEYLLYRKRLLTYIQGLDVNVSLIITGHSSGGATASLLAYDLVSLSYTNIQLYTFGSPRIGNKEFVNSFMSFDIQSNRITYKKDIVPHLPEELFGFVHIPHELWFTSSSKYKLCNDEDGKEDDSCSNSCSPFSCTSVSDHLNYLDSTIGSAAC